MSLTGAIPSKGVKVLYALPDGLYSNKYQSKPEGFTSNFQSEDKSLNTTDLAKGLIASRHMLELDQVLYKEQDLLRLQNEGYQLVIVEYVEKAC